MPLGCGSHVLGRNQAGDKYLLCLIHGREKQPGGCLESRSAGYCNVPFCIMYNPFLCIRLGEPPSAKTSSRVFSPWRQTFDIRETGPGRWCWHLIYILWPGQGGRTECCMHARDSTQQPRASSHPMRDWGLRHSQSVGSIQN